MLSWLRLLRISALPSAVSNILMGYVLAHQCWQPPVDLILLIVASSCLYLAGMISNDVFDLERDRSERPQRPLASGAIPVSTATAAFVSLMAIAAICGSFLNVSSLIVIATLIVCIFLYNGLLKTTLIAPLIMGACRTLNVLLGASTIETNAATGWLGFTPIVWWVAISLGGFITGVTFFSRHETKTNPRGRLIYSALLIVLGILGFATAPLSHDLFPGSFVWGIAKPIKIGYPVLIALVSIPIARRVLGAISTPNPRDIQMAVVTALRSLIIFDAAVCFLVMQSQLLYPLAVLLLLIPSLLLTKLVPPT